ncbi:hypothetical protein GII30_00915 [Gordonia amarae]|uniref:ESX-1 scaffolding and assembly protein SaeC n=2 Tax=Gordonia amarae TaxID=36821 RepID=G7GUR6_9ACTN|nr:hypothetical protein [Gordonia amarae]MCS3876903.1 hypothetical protein [Gordonia amarae]QHN15734.1 hypothetical protein GII35_00915 [Gordonia amarae]QHN20303.1 hypothetical protein GII34_00915 [Gordonia amarae]QHN29154.1 hypothetical protein GII32_00920 [Gordonia amarae]QHN37933.1 hypothetical protein GII30_00915 [Gordonia amarae]
MTKCPRCFHDLPDDEFAWYDSADTRVELNQVASRYAGGDVHTRSVHTVLRPPDADHTWSPVPEDVAHHVEVCPLCHYDLPGNWRWGDATCIAMAGARYTGKTVYIAVLIKQLKKFLEAADTEVTPADMVTERTYAANYERPLFEQRGIAAATPAAAVAAHQPPLIFNIGFWGERQHFLVIRDVAGEDLENAETSGPSWEFFGLAHAVLFLFDPLRVRDISDQLLDLVPPTNLIGGDPGDVLRKVMSLIGRGNPRIGLVLSKFDALQALSRVEQSSWGRVMANPGAAFNRDPGLVAAEYDEDDGTLLHCEVVSLLQRLHAGPMLRTLRNPVTGQYYENRFFAVSALGMPPVGEKLHRSGISPFRCLDPIRWVLAERGVSQT